MIGGEFEIGFSGRSDSFIPARDTYYYASGRSALYQILKSLTPRRHKLFLPDYLCHTIVEAVVKAGYEYSFYELDVNLMASPSVLERRGFKAEDVVLIINYFGLQNLELVAKEIKEVFPGAIIIEDDVQAFFSFWEEPNPAADYRFASLRKWFPVPDGGLVYTKNPMPEAPQSNTFASFKILAGKMKARRGKDGIKDEDYLALFGKGELLIDENYEARMSEDGKSLFANTDLHRVRSQRQKNARYLLEGLRRLSIPPLIPVDAEKVPLFIPVFISDRNTVRCRMFEKGVYCPVHWPVPEGLAVLRGKMMAENELSLIVDQRYGQTDMETILDLLK